MMGSKLIADGCGHLETDGSAILFTSKSLDFGRLNELNAMFNLGHFFIHYLKHLV